MIRKRVILIGLLLGFLAVLGIANIRPANIAKLDPLQTIRIAIPSGVTFGQLVRFYGVATSTTQSIIEATKSQYDLAKIISGRELALSFDSFTGGVKKMVYSVSADQRLIAQAEESEAGEPTWKATLENIPYEIKEKEAGGVISKSLYETVIDAGMDQRLALAMAEVFAWQVDFATDIREGDSFKVIYEERYLDGQYVMPGKILAAGFINDGAQFKAFYFRSEKTEAGYYDENGAALQKVFLKSPLQYKYISSGFSYGRVNPITKVISAHRAIDYAAAYNTPAVSVGDGTVTQAGWNGDYGISVTVRHNETYSTIYGHFSSLAKGIKRGVKVRQGQVVGYVGSTGLSTGPHLHFELHKYGAKVNPFKEEVPPGQPVNEADKDSLSVIVQRYTSKL
ncbi:MAG: peptidoglycan DD-metalloendopeptidase family protein [bacterium]|nr:peptidoglycan DD-metalloendopeptidase family protein [bacterium]